MPPMHVGMMHVGRGTGLCKLTIRTQDEDEDEGEKLTKSGDGIDRSIDLAIPQRCVR